NAVIGFSEMLCAGMAGPLTAKQTDYLGDIRASGSHLLALVDDVLDVGKVEKGRIELTLETCLVRNLVGQSVAVFRDQAQRAGISLTSDCPRSVGAVLADERKVKQILLNLLSNAIKFTPRGGRVEVRAREAGEVVFITVTDDGPGVPEGDRDRIFAAFEQGPVATTGAPGTGLGLAVARRLAEAHGGTLGVAPETDRGATFLLSLPRRPVSAGSASTSAGDAGEPSGAEQAIEPGALEGRSVLAHLEGRDGLARSRARIAGTAALIESVTFGLLPVLPGAPRHLHLWGWPYITIFGVVAGIALLLPRSRVSANGLYAGMIVAVASTGWYVYSVRHGLTSSLAMILMLQGMAAFTFFRLRRAAVIGVEIAVVYGATVLHETHVGVGILRWAVTVGLVAASAIMARWLPYLSALAQSERQARADAEEVNRQLRTASHHKSEFLASMSHELRTPLNAIIGFADALQQEMFGALAPKQAEYVADIAAAGHHLLDLINDILDLAKADAGRLQLARRRTALAEVLEPACRRASEAAERASVGFEWRLDPDVADLDVDPVRLAQAVESVVRDAVAFTPTGGTVSLDARIHAGQVLIGVGHTGPAPALTDPERLFAPFEYGGDTHPGPGNWVGLALARQIVQLHGGSLSLECRAEQGSSFTLTLPTAGAAGPPPHPGDPRAQPAPSAS
ncbi:MAG TPA: HAMP domain-containing sensor histidine kinase, partial [Acidimicrobiales bacterium]|nr:HAMP domain-containing sensor histidine kinase [Acidimicrobiales bacterium]